MAGRLCSSFISSVLRLFLSIQFRSAEVYAVSGQISKRSPPVTAESVFASFAVSPLAEKYAIRILFIGKHPLKIIILSV